MKRAALLFLIVMSLLLTSCGISVEDLLVAPLLTADQSAILAVIQAANTERTLLKYPVSGDWRTPIQFFDLNGDGIEEAIVFYSVAPEVNTRIAVLGKGAEGWIIHGELLGGGPEVNSVQVLAGMGANMLVEWGSVNPSNRQFTVYNFIGGELRVGFNEECSDILMEDFSGSGTVEFCYVTAESPGEPFRIVYADYREGKGYVSGTQIKLRPEMVALLSLKTIKDRNGRQLVFVDESIEGSLAATEVFIIGNGKLSYVELEADFDIFLLSMRRDDLVCRVFPNIRDDRIMIPSDAAPRETIVDEALWTYWYFIDGESSLSYGFASFVNMALNLNVGTPEEWLDRVIVVENEEEQRLYQFIDFETEEIVFEIKVLRVDDNPQEYEVQGFQTIQKNDGGAYRYLYRAGDGCLPREERYVTEHFYGIVS